MNTQLILKLHHYHHHILPPPSITTTSSRPSNLNPSLLHILTSTSLSLHFLKPTPSYAASAIALSSWNHHHHHEDKEQSFDVDDGGSVEFEDLATDSRVYNNTLRLVECSMFAAVAGLAYLLSNSLAIENYFGCFFALPIVISSMRWGIAAGRKTMVATAVLLLVLSGPVKALTYVLMHGLLGFTMGSLWRLQVRWSLSIFLCTLVRAVGALGYVLISSFLIRENILGLITINVHATLTLIFNSLGFYTVPSMSTIYAIFVTLLLLNCCCFVFLLHILYALFLTRLGMKASLMLPRFLQNAL